MRIMHRGSAVLQKYVTDRGFATFGCRTALWLLLPFAGGLGLVLWVLTGLSFREAGGIVALLGAVAWTCGLYLLTPRQRATVWKRVCTGIMAGILATLAYDASRYLSVALVEMSVQPFAALPIFGRLIIGPNHSRAALYVTGYMYHFFINGIGFAIAYTISFRRPGPVTGILWALGLEAIMAVLYPQFLIIKQYGEFLTMSVIGHISYGVVLGLWAKAHAKAVVSSPAGRENHPDVPSKD
jgi:hypothetical protein